MSPEPNQSTARPGSPPPPATTTTTTTTPFTVVPSLAFYKTLRPAHPSPSPATTHPTLYPFPIDHFLASTFVFDASSRLLLVQRSATDAFPLCWEIPGGSVDPADESVLHAAARELQEEAGLRATAFVGCADRFGEGRWPHVFVDVREGREDRVWCRLAFLVEVEGGGGRVGWRGLCLTRGSTGISCGRVRRRL